MAYFSLINEDNTVIQVCVVDDENCLDENGQEQEYVGIDFLERHSGYVMWPKSFDTNGNVTEYYDNKKLSWKQTNDDAKEGVGFRKNYAGIGYKWEEGIEGYVTPKPPDPKSEEVEGPGEYVLNEEKAIWEYSGKLKNK